MSERKKERKKERKRERKKERERERDFICNSYEMMTVKHYLLNDDHWIVLIKILL